MVAVAETGPEHHDSNGALESPLKAKKVRVACLRRRRLTRWGVRRDIVLQRSHDDQLAYARSAAMSAAGAPEAPRGVSYGLEEALELLAALEDAREVVSGSANLAVRAELEHQIVVLSRRLGFSSCEEDGRGR
jgi:hypothetical protein